MNKDVTIKGVDFVLDGQPVEIYAEPGARLSQVLREDLGARDVKIGCNAGDCGACTVLLDGAPICACLTPAHQVAGRQIETLAGLCRDEPLVKTLGERFQDMGAAQCGICTPGMMVSAVALLRETPTPTEDQVKDALGGVLCRCTGYRKIIDAVMGAPALAQSSDGSIGQSMRHVDGDDKVSGRQLFGDDVAPAGTLEILIIRSPYDRAAFQFGDLDDFAQSTTGAWWLCFHGRYGRRNGAVRYTADHRLAAIDGQHR